MEIQVQANVRDRRWAVRRVSRGGVEFGCRKGNHGFGPNILVKVSNVSQTGACVLLSAAVKEKDEVEVSIEGFAGLKSKLLGRIAWVCPQENATFLVGVPFEKALSFAEFQQITRQS
jgi:hypothetical protein